MKLKLFLLLLLCGAALFFCMQQKGLLRWPRKIHRPSDHSDGRRFLNARELEKRFIWPLLKWIFFTKRSYWPDYKPRKSFLSIPKLKKDQISFTFLNHASFLVQSKDLTFIFDPIFSMRASPVSWAGPKRCQDPGIRYEELPSIDLVLISHDHYDHMDKETLQNLMRDHKPHFVVGLGCKDILLGFGIPEAHISEMDWDDSFSFKGAEITFCEAQHFSGRGLLDRNSTLWGAYKVSLLGKSIYFAGDTGYGDHFKSIYKKYGSVDVALLPIGAYKPRWFMRSKHVNPTEAVKAHLDLKAQLSLGMHYETFPLANESFDQPRLDLKEALKNLNVPEHRFIAPQFGQSFTLRIASR